MNVKSAVAKTVCRNGRLCSSIVTVLSGSRFAALQPRLGHVVCATRSLTASTRSVAPREATRANPVRRRHSLADFSSVSRNCGIWEQYTRGLTTQASPAADVNEAEKSKASTNKTQVLLDEVVSLVAGGKVTLVDVREPDELQKTGGLPGCINIPLTKLKAALALSDEEFKATYHAPKPSKDDSNVIYYGLSSVKSSAAVEIAHKMGFKKSRHYPGGMEEWNQKHQKS